jgi:hypothetical protein
MEAIRRRLKIIRTISPRKYAAIRKTRQLVRENTKRIRGKRANTNKSTICPPSRGGIGKRFR